MHGMPRGVVLRDNWFIGGHRRLRGGLLFYLISVCMLELSCRIFSSKCRLFKLLIMSRRIILRYYRLECSDRNLRSGLLFSCCFNSLFKLFIGIVLIVCIIDELLKLSCRILSTRHGTCSMYSMPRRVLLCFNWPHCGFRYLLSRILFGFILVGVFELSCRIFSIDGRLIQLHIMSRRLVLHHHRPECSDWSLYCGLLLGRFLNSLFELSIGIVLSVRIVDQLLQLSCGHFSGFDRVNFLYGMSRGVVLRDNWSIGGHRHLCGGLLFCVIGIRVFELSCGIFSSNCRLVKLYLVYCRIILRYYGPDCSDWSLCSRLILGRIFKCLFKLSIGDIYVIRIFNELLELSRWLFSGLNRLHRVYGMPRRILLRDSRSYSSYRQLLSGIVFSFIIVGVFELCRRIFPSNCRLVKLCIVSRRLILRYYGPDCSDGRLCSWLVLLDIFKCLFELFIGIVLIGCIID